MLGIIIKFMINQKDNIDNITYIILTVILSGGVGNCIDRIFRGYVVDFIDVRCFDFWYWIFNVADSAICVGAVLLFLAAAIDAYREGKNKCQKKQ